jgi:hypothetical protein
MDKVGFQYLKDLRRWGFERWGYRKKRSSRAARQGVMATKANKMLWVDCRLVVLLQSFASLESRYSIPTIHLSLLALQVLLYNKQARSIRIRLTRASTD